MTDERGSRLMDDFRAERARDHHERADIAADRAFLHRRRRDEFIRELRAEDPKMWSYAQLAEAVGCSKTLIRQILDQEGNKSNE